MQLDRALERYRRAVVEQPVFRRSPRWLNNAVLDDFDHPVSRDIGFLAEGAHVQLNDQGAAHDQLLH
ncbi:hypothetical protein D3C81_2277980 [compost metagenome]